MASSSSSSILQKEKVPSFRDIKNAELIEYPLNEEDLNKWSLPKVDKHLIYQIGTFDFKGKTTIKMVEQSITIDSTEKTISLLSYDDLKSYMQEYKYLHIGLIQIAFKPLTLRGLNASILSCLRDGRCLNWAQSLMGVMETSLCHGPVYFNTFPNLSLSLTDIHLFEALKLHLQLHGYNFLPGSETIALIYRIHFKIMNTLSPRVKKIVQPTSRTTLIETNLLASNIATNRVIRWNEVTFPEQWTLPQVITPQPIINQDIEQIVQTSDGDVEVRFNPRRSIHLPRISIPSTTEEGRTSKSDDSETSSNPRLILNNNRIFHPIRENQNYDSPTPSEMQF